MAFAPTMIEIEQSRETDLQNAIRIVDHLRTMRTDGLSLEQAYSVYVRIRAAHRDLERAFQAMRSDPMGL
jgi:hypothetical protein